MLKFPQHAIQTCTYLLLDRYTKCSSVQPSELEVCTCSVLTYMYSVAYKPPLLLTGVFDYLHKHWEGLSTKGLRETYPLPQGCQPPQTRQVGDQSAHCIPTAGEY